jgi:hypothetical protein
MGLSDKTGGMGDRLQGTNYLAGSLNLRGKSGKIHFFEENRESGILANRIEKGIGPCIDHIGRSVGVRFFKHVHGLEIVLHP